MDKNQTFLYIHVYSWILSTFTNGAKQRIQLKRLRSKAGVCRRLQSKPRICHKSGGTVPSPKTSSVFGVCVSWSLLHRPQNNHRQEVCVNGGQKNKNISQLFVTLFRGEVANSSGRPRQTILDKDQDTFANLSGLLCGYSNIEVGDAFPRKYSLNFLLT